MIATLVPPGAHRVTIFPCHPIGNRETKCISDFFGLYFTVHGTGNDVDTFFGERCTALLKACKQATTEGSPMAAVKKNDGERRLQVLRQAESISACNF